MLWTIVQWILGALLLLVFVGWLMAQLVAWRIRWRRMTAPPPQPKERSRRDL
jgi:hypothetical protein